MRLARTLSSLCVACVLTPFIGAGPATQPAAPATENEQLRQRVAQLEAEVADLRTKLDRAMRPDAIKSGLALRDELKIDYVPAPAREPAPPRVTGTGSLILKGGNISSAGPSTLQVVPRPPTPNSSDDRPRAPN
jgi:hypothetical protein